MANVRLSLTMPGADQLVRNMSDRVGKRRVNQVIKRNVAQLNKRASRGAPVDTGHMRRSIKPELFPEVLSGEVTAHADYAAYVNYGTRFMDARPFMTNAKNEQIPIFLNDMRNLVKGR